MMKRTKVTTLVASVMAAGLLLGAAVWPAFGQTTDTTDGDVLLDGILSVVHVDEVDPAKSRYEYFVEDVKTKAMTQLFFKLPPNRVVELGAQVEI